MLLSYGIIVAMSRKSSLVPRVSPAFGENKKAIVFAVDQNYLPYLGVCLYSLLAHCRQETKYDICVLHDGTLRLQDEDWAFARRDNVSLRFVNLDLSRYPFDFQAHLRGYYTVATYYRFFVPEIFAAYERVIYLDTDMLILADIAELFSLDLQGNCLAAGENPPFALELDEQYVNYITKKLHVPAEKYYCAGIMVTDIPKLKQLHFLPRCLHKLEELGRPTLVDQDVINCLYHGQSLILPREWNYVWEPLLSNFTSRVGKLSPESQEKWHTYGADAQRAKIIHYSSSIKPWRAPAEPLAEKWWAWARQTPWAAQLQKALDDAKT